MAALRICLRWCRGMSHAATNWAITQRGLKPATRVVLWHLCDRHNPDLGCFPSQDKLAYDCEMSRSALNEHLKILERIDLIRREQHINPRTKQQENTRYRFSFEADFVATQDVVVPSPESGHGAVSGKEAKPCPEIANSRVRNPDTNLVREPVREPPGRADALGGGDFDILWDLWPEKMRPDSREAAARTFAPLGADAKAMAIATAETYRTAMILRKEKPLMIPFLKKQLFLEFHGGPPIDKDGDFVITPDRPEWGEWLGSIRRQFGDRGVESTIKCRRILRKTRWPSDLSLAQSVTKMATSVTETAPASAARD